VQPPPSDDGLDEALAQPEPAAPRGASAHDLFSAANAARVRGDVGEAIALSRLLEDRFPLSSEAKTTHLTLGMLYLQGGQAAPALHEFRQCKALGASATMPEALWGESQALRALGRYAEERAVLEELLQGFPQSAYASAATKRLADSH
jgi:TolA-binding protein